MDNLQLPIINYQLNEVTDFINWLYFFHAWGFAPRFATIAQVHTCPGCEASWLSSFEPQEQPKAREAIKLIHDARQLLGQLDGKLTCRCVFQLFETNASGDNLLINGTLFPLLRQQHIHPEQPCLCLSDFVRPCDRLVEASVEKLHLYVRKEVWGYAPDEHLSIADLLLEKFQGIRPAVGYPSLPDQSVNFIINQLIDLSQIGITLTENGAMHPHASVSGLMLAHPQARYFSVGKIGEDQLFDYSQRRGLPIDTMRKFLSANL